MEIAAAVVRSANALGVSHQLLRETIRQSRQEDPKPDRLSECTEDELLRIIPAVEELIRMKYRERDVQPKS